MKIYYPIEKIIITQPEGARSPVFAVRVRCGITPSLFKLLKRLCAEDDETTREEVKELVKQEGYCLDKRDAIKANDSYVASDGQKIKFKMGTHHYRFIKVPHFNLFKITANTHNWCIESKILTNNLTPLDFHQIIETHLNQ